MDTEAGCADLPKACKAWHVPAWLRSTSDKKSRLCFGEPHKKKNAPVPEGNSNPEPGPLREEKPARNKAAYADNALLVYPSCILLMYTQAGGQARYCMHIGKYVLISPEHAQMTTYHDVYGKLRSAGTSPQRLSARCICEDGGLTMVPAVMVGKPACKVQRAVSLLGLPAKKAWWGGARIIMP